MPHPPPASRYPRDPDPKVLFLSEKAVDHRLPAWVQLRPEFTLPLQAGAHPQEVQGAKLEFHLPGGLGVQTDLLPQH